MRSPHTRGLLRLLTAALIVGVVLLPVIAFYAGAAAEESTGDPRLPSISTFLRSLILSMTAAAVALLLGLAAALAMTRVDAPATGILPFLALVPLAIPPTIQAYAWLTLPGWAYGILGGLVGASPGGSALGATPWGAGVILGVCLWPIVAFLGAAGLGAGSGSLEQAAAPYAGERRILWRVVLPGLWPSVLTGAAIVFWMSLANFSVPSLLALRSLSVHIFEGVSVGTRSGEAALGSLLLLAAAAPLLVGLALLLRKRPPLSLGVPSGGLRLRRLRPAILMVTAAAIGVGAALPVFTLAGQAGGLVAFRRALVLGGRGLANSALVAAAAATLATGMGLLSAAVVPRRGWGRRCTWVTGLLAFVLPGFLLGQGLTYVYNRPGPPSLVYEGWPILALGVGAAFFLPAFAALGAAHAGIPATAQESAAAAGAGPVRTLLRITFPLLARDIGAVWLVLFTLAFGEAGAAILREPPGFQTAQVFLFNQMHYGRDQDVAALALISVLISLVPLLLAAYLWRRRGVAR